MVLVAPTAAGEAHTGRGVPEIEQKECDCPGLASRAVRVPANVAAGARHAGVEHCGAHQLAPGHGSVIVRVGLESGGVQQAIIAPRQRLSAVPEVCSSVAVLVLGEHRKGAEKDVPPVAARRVHSHVVQVPEP